MKDRTVTQELNMSGMRKRGLKNELREAQSEVKLTKIMENLLSLHNTRVCTSLHTGIDWKRWEATLISIRDFKIKYMITFMIALLNNKDTAVCAVFHRERGLMNMLGLIYAG